MTCRNCGARCAMANLKAPRSFVRHAAPCISRRSPATAATIPGRVADGRPDLGRAADCREGRRGTFDSRRYAGALAVSDLGLTIDSTRTAAIQLNDAHAGAQNLVSAFQTNSRFLKLTRLLNWVLGLVDGVAPHRSAVGLARIKVRCDTRQPEVVRA